MPCFLIATVDKFAALPWSGEVGAFFGRVDRYDQSGFYGSCQPTIGNPLPGGRLPPPELIIQDELHLISGPLGTMMGLYESALFFAVVHFPDQSNARRYVGVDAQGRSLKVVMLRLYLALLAASQAAYNAHPSRNDPNNPAHPHMTLLGYFNSLRELGGARRLIEDEISSSLVGYQDRKHELLDRSLVVPTMDNLGAELFREDKACVRRCCGCPITICAGWRRRSVHAASSSG